MILEAKIPENGLSFRFAVHLTLRPKSRARIRDTAPFLVYQVVWKNLQVTRVNLQVNPINLIVSPTPLPTYGRNRPQEQVHDGVFRLKLHVGDANLQVYPAIGIVKGSNLQVVRLDEHIPGKNGKV